MNAATSIAPTPLPARDARRGARLHEAGHTVAILELWPTRRFLVPVELTASEHAAGVGGVVRPVRVVPRWGSRRRKPVD